MPEFPFPGRAGRERGEPVLDMIISGRSLPPDAPQEMHALADALADLAGPAEPGKLPGEAAARFAFTRRRAVAAGVWPAALRPARRRSWPSARRAGLAAALVAAVGLGGTAAVYAGLLPGPFPRHVGGAAPRRPGPLKPHPARSGTRQPNGRSWSRRS